MKFEEVEEFDIPSYVTKLSNGCFRQCKYTKITIPTSVVEIERCCFNGMTSLKEIELPTNVTEFGEGLFGGCSSLTSITLHDNYNEVKEADFYQCRSLSSIVLPSTVTKISAYAFFGCCSLTSINLEHIKQFGKGCFYESGITKKNYPQVPYYCF